MIEGQMTVFFGKNEVSAIIIMCVRVMYTE